MSSNQKTITKLRKELAEKERFISNLQKENLETELKLSEQEKLIIELKDKPTQKTDAIMKPYGLPKNRGVATEPLTIRAITRSVIVYKIETLAILRLNGVKSKNWTSQQNELLAKILCHNIVVVIHEMFELGIDADFSI